LKTHHSFEHGNVSEALPSIFSHVMMDGEEVGTRQGERAKEILMPRIALWKPWEREVLVPHRRASLPAQIAETMWVLAGRNDVEWLTHYLPRAADFSDDGTTWTGGYGPRIRRWYDRPLAAVTAGDHPIDQLDRVVNMLKNDRDTRRAIINIYDPSVDSVHGKDIPCNNWLSFISRLGKLHMNVATRSNDVMWGWSGINQFEWSVLQEIVAHLTGNQIGTLTFNVTSLHVYEKHWDKAARIVDSSGTTTYDHLEASPRFALEHRTVERLDQLIESWFMLEAMIRNGDPAEFHVDQFPEPMMQSWLRVIQWYWSRDSKYLEPIKGTRLCVAAMMSSKRKPTAPEQAVLDNPHVSQALKETFAGLSIPPLRQPDEPKPEDIKIPGTYPVGHDGTITIALDADTQLFDALKEHQGQAVSINEHAPDGRLVSVTPATVGEIVPSLKSTRGSHRPLAWTAQFVEFVDNLHREKSAVYGDSWKRRGEQMAILANIARKVDRLGEGGAGDTAADTVIDLLVYLAKYALWLNEHAGEPADDENEFVWGVLQSEDRRCVKVVQHASIPPRIVALKEYFEQLTIVVQSHEIENALQARMKIVDAMITQAFPVARYLWGVENGHILNPYQASELFTAPIADAGAKIAEARAEIKKANETRPWAGYESDGENID
jgi:thymidylate synthase